MKIPFSSKEDLRNAYPLGLQAVPDEEIVRIHSSSGTTGLPVIIPYTRQDVDDWATMMARCMTIAGVTNRDRGRSPPATASGRRASASRRRGARRRDGGPHGSRQHRKADSDDGRPPDDDVGATPSHACCWPRKSASAGLSDKIALKRGIIGSERWGDKMRDRIANRASTSTFTTSTG